ncbi:MAG: homocysteine S-methyltransferase family protein [Clostridia bacterium]|nr:homocysteine S-methyltransferase family protein [Clostridia bacterium]
MKKNFLEQLKSKILVLDGAMGTRLISRGLDSRLAMQYNVEKPNEIIDIHKSYRLAGSDVIYSNTFGANSFNLKDTGYTVAQIIKSAYKNAKVSTDGFIAYSCGPLGKLMYPTGELRFEEAYERFLEQAKVVAELGFDLVVIETFTDIAELRSAILAFKENTDLPIVCSMSFDENGRTFSGNDIESFARIAGGLGVDALGLNCGLGADKTLKNAVELSKHTTLPIFIKPNAGMPVYENGKTSYDMSADDFASWVGEIVKTVPNVQAVGGCCGTDDNYIRLLANHEFETAQKSFNKSITPALCSAQRRVEFDKFFVIGERLNPTGKPTLKKALQELDLEYVYGLCAEQIALGAQVIDVNVGMAGIDEAYVLGEIVEYLSGKISVPLCIDTTNVKALETALRRACGVVLINSVNGERESLKNVLPLCEKYGACIIGLCLDERGISENPTVRVEIAERIVKTCAGYGICKDRVFIDALTMAISVDDKNAVRTLDTLKKLNEYGVKTVLGLSNVSFGLPQRERINGVFYNFAKAQGLSCAIINPALCEVVDDFVAKSAVLGVDKDCEAYVAKYASAKSVVDKSREHTLKECVYFGLAVEGAKRVKEIATVDNYSDIINNDVISALNELGDDFALGKCFLPQLMSGAESARVILDYIRDKFMSDKDEKGAKIVLATVKGDVHDIGKNIVKAVLSNYGYDVIDLGRDVEIDKIISEIEKSNAKIVGLSALMTTTMNSMEESVVALRDRFPNLLILVGGAVVTNDFAERIGAKYAENAQECIKVLQNQGF